MSFKCWPFLSFQIYPVAAMCILFSQGCSPVDKVAANVNIARQSGTGTQRQIVGVTRVDGQVRACLLSRNASSIVAQIAPKLHRSDVSRSVKPKIVIAKQNLARINDCLDDSENFFVDAARSLDGQIPDDSIASIRNASKTNPRDDYKRYRPVYDKNNRRYDYDYGGEEDLNLPVHFILDPA